MVMPAARTGSEGTRSMDHTNRGVGCCDKAGGVMLMAVVLKLMAPKMEDTPARCREKMARSTEAPAWLGCLLGAGIWFILFRLQLLLWRTLGAVGRTEEVVQKPMLFMRGNAMSGAPIIRGTSQFPNPSIIMVITVKKILTKAWAVMMTL